MKISTWSIHVGICCAIGMVSLGVNNKIDKMASTEYIDKALQKLVTEDFVKSKLNDLRDDLAKEIKREIKSEIDKVYDKFRSVHTKLVEQATEIEDLKSATSDFESEMEKLKSEKLVKTNKDLKEAIKQGEISRKSHEKEINELEQYTRRNSLRIYGISDKERFESSNKTAELMVNLINSKLEIPIQPSDIDVAHRLGKFTSDGNRPIICKFVSREKKTSVLKARRKLKGSAIVIREDLTFKNAKLLESVSGRSEVKDAWSDEGKIFVLLHNGDKRRVDLHTDLNVALAENAR